jgi:glycosyltransferase involved in cell wall biosynthesis
LVEKKGIDVLLDALGLLQDRGVAFRCTIVGDGPERESLERRMASLGLDGAVRMLGERNHEEIVRLMNGSDLFTLPCRVTADGDRDALPTVLLEAMAAGLTCISTPVCGVPEMIRSGETGVLVPPESAPDLADSIADLIRSPAKRQRMGVAARLRAERLFDRVQNVGILRDWLMESTCDAASGRTARQHRRSPEPVPEQVRCVR